MFRSLLVTGFIALGAQGASLPVVPGDSEQGHKLFESERRHPRPAGHVLKAGRVKGALGGYSASPVAADGKLFLVSEDGKVAVLKAGRDWDVLAVNDLGEGSYATPALSEGRIYVRTEEALYCFGSSRNQPLSGGAPPLT